jgi:hypothetical protein
MSDTPPIDKSVKDKEVRAELARQRLAETVRELQTKLSPSTIAHKTTENLKARGKSAAQTGIDAARLYPERAAAVGGVLALLILRKPIFRLFRGRKRAPETTEQYTPEGN